MTVRFNGKRLRALREGWLDPNTGKRGLGRQELGDRLASRWSAKTIGNYEEGRVNSGPFVVDGRRAGFLKEVAAFFRVTVDDLLLDELSTEVAEPYRGLAPYLAEHARIFFGRDAEIAEVVAALGRSPVVVLAGASGVGKSSLVRAGLAPRLAGGEPFEGWEVVIVRPGDDPVGAIAAACAGGSAAAATQGVAGLSRALAELGEVAEVVLIVDQAEELFSARVPPELCERVFGALVAAAGAGLRVLLSIREDYLVDCRGVAALRPHLAGGVVHLGVMSRGALREAIEGPLRGRGVVFDEHLVDALLDAVDGQVGALPLLQVLLAGLWADAEQRRLTWAAYHGRGGLLGAIESHAEAQVAALGADRIGDLRAVLESLVDVAPRGGFVGRRVAVEALEAVSAGAPAVIEALVSARLLIVSADSNAGAVVGLAHDALFREWKRMWAWLREDAACLERRRLVEHDAARWRDEGMPIERLLGSAALGAVQGLPAHLALSSVGAELVAASRAYAGRRWRLRAALVAAVTVTSIVLLLLVLGRFADHDRLAWMARSREVDALQRQASLVERRDPAAALAHHRAAEAGLAELGGTPGGEIDPGLVTRLEQGGAMAWVFPVASAALSVTPDPSGRFLAIGEVDGLEVVDLAEQVVTPALRSGNGRVHTIAVNGGRGVLAWDEGCGRSLFSWSADRERPLQPIALPDAALSRPRSRCLAAPSLSRDGAAMLLPVEDGFVHLRLEASWEMAVTPIPAPPGGEGGVGATSGDGSRVAVVERDGAIAWMDVRPGARWVALPRVSDTACDRDRACRRQIALDGVGGLVAVGEMDQVEVRSLRDGAVIHREWARGDAQVSFSPDGALLIARGLGDAVFHAWRVERDLGPPRVLPLPVPASAEAPLESVSFAGQGDSGFADVVVIATDYRGASRVFLPGVAAPLRVVKGPTRHVYGAAFFHPAVAEPWGLAGSALVTVAGDAEVRVVWGVSGDHAALVGQADGAPSRSRLAPGGAFAVSDGAGGELVLRAAGGARRPLDASGARSFGLAISRDARWVAVGVMGGVDLWPARPGGERVALRSAYRPSGGPSMWVGVSADGARAAAIAEGRTPWMTVWDVGARRVVCRGTMNDAPVDDLVVSFEGVLVPTRRGLVAFRCPEGQSEDAGASGDIDEGAVAVGARVGPDAAVATLAVSADGSRGVVGYYGRSAERTVGHRPLAIAFAMGDVWERGAAAPWISLEGHRADVVAAVAAADGGRVVTGSWDRRVVLWDAASGASIAEWVSRGRVRHLAASPDLEEVASADDGGLVSLLRLSDGRLVERAARGAEDGWVRELAWDGRALHMLDRSGVARRWPLDEAPPTRWDLLGTWTNLRVCRETGEVVPVVPFPSDPTSVWAPPGACGPVGSGAPTDLGGAGRPLVGRAPSPERGWAVGGAGLVSSLLGWVAGG